MASERGKKKPSELNFDSIVCDLCFHPTKDVIAAASIDGDVTIHSYSIQENNHLLLTLPHHKKACRAIGFAPNGEWICSISKDKSLQVVDLEQGKLKYCIKKAHESAIYSLLIAEQNIVATGDDDGTIKAWDLRQQKAVMELKENEEFISDIIINNNKRLLLTTSGDGTLTAFDIRKHKMKMQSEIFDSELLSLALIKREGKLVCGTGDGVLNIFNYGEWGNISDRFPGHPMSVDCVIPITEDIICTGSMDGIIRAVNILPNRIIGSIGEHDEFPVENLSKSHCNKYLASCSHDQKIKFWNIEDLPSIEVDGSKKARKYKNTPLAAALPKDDFFSDMAAGEDESKDKDNEDVDSGDDDSNDDDDEDLSSDEGAKSLSVSDNVNDTSKESDLDESKNEHNLEVNSDPVSSGESEASDDQHG